MLSAFQNCPTIDFKEPKNRAAMEAALKHVEENLGKTYPLVIGGEKVATKATIRSYDPCETKVTVGLAGKASADQAREAIGVAAKAFETWSYVDPEVRARYLLRAARVMRDRRIELAAWEVREASKTWAEADADVAEAIDFLEFYAREACRYGAPHPLTPVPGEENHLYYIPLGVGVVIPPWNFPLAILAGMTSAAIVAGNTVVLKPASVTPVIGALFCQILNEEAMLPPGVLNFCPGGGGEIGDLIVEDPRTRFIAFTGSKEVGLRIHELASKPRPGQIWIKRTILEMGGKDAIVVDETADLKAAIDGAVRSAFGYQGQKCSACSRLIVTAPVYDQVLDGVVRGAKALKVGPARDPTTDVGAVIDENAYKSILGYIDIGKKEGRLAAGGSSTGSGGHFIEPTVIADLAPSARVVQEEIFGPVLSVCRAKDWSDALAMANGTEFGLTGSVYTRRGDRIEEARRRFHCGNLYINRKCTGALVGGHPFGGFNMSGTDSKAGGRDYLGLFLQAKVVSERL